MMENKYQTKHKPVLVDEVLTAINPKSGMTIVDCTLGGAGHFREMIVALGEVQEETILIGIDQDEDVVIRAKKYFEAKNLPDKLKIRLVHANFDNLKEELRKLKIVNVDRILADLGTSQDQIEDDTRGFSYKANAKLDMRMDRSLNISAADLVNVLTYSELVELFTRLADLHHYAKPVARTIVEHRKKQAILTTKELTDLIYQAVPSSKGSRNKNRSERDLRARVFQALRIAVNHEFDSLQRFLPQAYEALKLKGRLVVISFHSGEDKLVKKYFQKLENENKAVVEGGLILPGQKEILHNPRSSSARMRTILKIK